MSRVPKSRHAYRDAVLSEHGPSTSAARLVALALTARMDAETLESFAGAELLAALTALSERTVRTALHALKAEGWIEERTKGRGRDYALRIRRATFPPGLPARAAASQQRVAAKAAGTQVAANSAGVAANSARVAADIAASGGKEALGVPATVAAYPESDPESDPEKDPGADPGAAPPSPAEAGCAAHRRWSRAEVLAREEQVNADKEAEERHAKRGQAVGRLLREGKTPEQIAAELGESLEFVRSRKALRDAMPMLGSSRKDGSA